MYLCLPFAKICEWVGNNRTNTGSNIMSTCRKLCSWPLVLSFWSLLGMLSEEEEEEEEGRGGFSMLILSCYGWLEYNPIVMQQTVSVSLKKHFSALGITLLAVGRQKGSLLPDTHTLTPLPKHQVPPSRHTLTPLPKHLEDKYLCFSGDSFPINTIPLTSTNYHRSLSLTLTQVWGIRF